MSQRTVLSADDLSRAITRISHEITESNHGSENLVLLGIPTRGVHIAERIAAVISSAYPGSKLEVGSIDVTLYRDDLADQPTRPLGRTSIPASGIAGQTVVLVDDVLYSGRTVRSALDALNDHGRPKAVRLAVLVDRGHRELPIRADFVGKNLPTATEERISVRLVETDGTDEVVISS
ncbi:MAG: bifunctional pyr operon transcriptional regulator/uracil phosphoribosyltransferase PyrR [Actinomycetota bacterium]